MFLLTPEPLKEEAMFRRVRYSLRDTNGKKVDFLCTHQLMPRDGLTPERATPGRSQIQDGASRNQRERQLDQTPPDEAAGTRSTVTGKRLEVVDQSAKPYGHPQQQA